jgi:hypothetical protein
MKLTDRPTNHLHLPFHKKLIVARLVNKFPLLLNSKTHSFVQKDPPLVLFLFDPFKYSPIYA